MERLTVKGPSGLISLKDKSENGANQAIKCLSEYEDTGLTPDEVKELAERDTAKAPEEIQDAFGDARLVCPHCRNSVINYFNRSRPPQFCMICGQRLRWEGLHD